MIAEDLVSKIEGLLKSREEVFGLERAESYSEMFEIFGKRGIMDQELVSKLADMTGFRNLLVHGYAKNRKFESP